MALASRIGLAGYGAKENSESTLQASASLSKLLGEFENGARSRPSRGQAEPARVGGAAAVVVHRAQALAGLGSGQQGGW